MIKNFELRYEITLGCILHITLHKYESLKIQWSTKNKFKRQIKPVFTIVSSFALIISLRCLLTTPSTEATLVIIFEKLIDGDTMIHLYFLLRFVRKE